MHANGILLNRLFTALDEHDARTMASCYHPEARFRDIAFDLRGADEIYDMWRMICRDDVDLKVSELDILEADERAGRVRLSETYTFTRKNGDKVPVRNAIESRFRFEDGLIVRQDDDCDPKEWARQALGDGIGGFLAGRIRLPRSLVAKAKLAKFVRTHPE